MTLRRLVWGIGLLTLLMIGPAVQAGPTIGIANTGNCYPFLCNDSGTSVGPSIHYQQVYDASKFSGVTDITSVSFFFMFAQQFGGSATILNGNYVVSLSTTSALVNGLNGGSLSSNIGADNALFFSGNVGGPIPASDIFTIGGTLFHYDPSMGNLLLDIQVSNQDLVPNGSNNSYFDADSTGANGTSRAYSFLGSDSGVADTVGLVTEFNLQGGVVPEPSTMALMGVGLLCLAGVNYTRRKLAAR